MTLSLYLIHKLGSTPRFLSSYNILLNIQSFVESATYVFNESLDFIHFLDPFVAPHSAFLPGYIPRKLTPQEQSVFVKHAFSFFALAQSKSTHALIFEDDALPLHPLFTNFFSSLNLHSQTFPQILFLGDGCHEKPPLASYSGIIDPVHTHHKSKCADSYIITKDIARRILLDYLSLPPFMPFDWDLSLRILRLEATVGWLYPPITNQGSQNGTFASTIQPL